MTKEDEKIEPLSDCVGREREKKKMTREDRKKTKR